VPAPLPWWRSIDLADAGFRLLCQGAAWLVVAVLVLLVAILTRAAWPAISTYGFGFLFTYGWNPSAEKFGALGFVWGTVSTSALAMLIAVPLGIGTATYLAEIAPGWVRRTGSFLVELLAAIPSVVYGFWGYYFLLPLLRHLFAAVEPPLRTVAGWHVGGWGFGWVIPPNGNPDGTGLLAAGLVLAIMVLPYITAVSFDVCQAVPRSQREGSLALGSTRWQMIWRVVLPYARPGIVGGCFLALGRALGETMAVIMLIGGDNNVLSFSPLGKGASIASVIASSFSESTAGSLQRSVLVELGLVLLLVTIVINCIARFLIWRVQSGRGGLGWWPAIVARPPAPAEGSAAGPPPGPEVPRSNRLAGGVNRFMTGVLLSCLVVTIVPLFVILSFIAYNGVTALDWSFFTNLPYDRPPGLSHALVGSALMVSLATVGAVPVGLLAAVFLVEFRANRLAPVVRFVGELLGGVPSIVIGMFGYAVVGSVTGYSGWAGSFALGVMMVPIVMRTSEEALKLVPESLRTASYALGAAHWQTVLRVTIPAATSAIVTGVFLAIARIAGETAPLLLTADSSTEYNFTMNGPMPYLTYYIYNWATQANEEHNRVAWAAAFVLLALVMLLNVGIRLVTGRRVVAAARAD
jgi:phosphate transport system permease protein